MKKSWIAMGCMSMLVSTGMVFAQDKGKGKGAAGNVAKGKEAFEVNCSGCHNADTEERKMGPGLKGLSKHPKLANGEDVSDASITKMVNEGGNGMPPFGDLLTAGEKADLLAYLKSL